MPFKGFCLRVIKILACVVKSHDLLKTLPQCHLSYLANFPKETDQLENGPNSIRVSLIVPSKYFICSRVIFTDYENVYEL